MKACTPCAVFRTIALLVLSLAATLAACAHAPGAAGGRPLRVMSFNIAAGIGGLDAIVSTIRASEADVVALQEVDVHWSPRSGFVDQATTLGARLGMQVRFAPIYRLPPATDSTPPREYGVALLSRHPILAFSNRMLTRRSTQDTTAPPAPMPGLLDATLDVAGERIRVLDTHLDYRADPTVRRQQVAEMIAVIGGSDLPTILMGDLNAPPAAPELAPLLARLADRWPADAGPGFTYPAKAPARRIDFVLTSSHFRTASATVPATLVSDHRPVVVDLVRVRRGATEARR